MNHKKKTKDIIGIPKGRQIDPLAESEIQALLSGCSKDRSSLIENLHLVQDQFNKLTFSHLNALADFMSLSQTEVYEVASFYHHFNIVKENQSKRSEVKVRVCSGISCELAGSKDLYARLIDANLIGTEIVYTSCVGACDNAPITVVGQNKVTMSTLNKITTSISKQKFTFRRRKYQSLTEYIKVGGYTKFKGCYKGELSRKHVLNEIEISNLRGMGGAGFPTFKKWQFLEAKPKPRVLVVNADEGEPGTFKDRHCLETMPHKVLEGMLIAAWAVEADEAYIYLRDEYPEIRQILLKEIAAINNLGLNENIKIILRRGAGAYICGEESAMLESIEGKRGLPRNRPPYPAEKGLFGRPTLINNVETLHWVREIIYNGGDWYISNGQPRLYSVSGRVKKPGVVEAPSGVSAFELINDYCGGISEGQKFKAYLPGGASGGLLPSDLAKIPLTFDSLEQYGCFVGSGAIVIFSDHDKIPDVVINLLNFFAYESCGQCTPCRLGCEKLTTLVKHTQLDETLVNDLIEVMRDASICGLGQAAPNPLSSGLRYFREEFE